MSEWQKNANWNTRRTTMGLGEVGGRVVVVGWDRIQMYSTVTLHVGNGVAGQSAR